MLHTFWITLVAAAIFALYFLSIGRIFTEKEALQTFLASFNPLSAFFTALAFFGLVLGLWHQASELNITRAEIERERGERMKELILVTRLQAAGLRLISMSIEKDENSKQARAELESMVAQLEDYFTSAEKPTD